jgi:hypothetical protein
MVFAILLEHKICAFLLNIAMYIMRASLVVYLNSHISILHFTFSKVLDHIATRTTMSCQNHNDTTYTLTHVGSWSTNAPGTRHSSATSASQDGNNITLKPHPDMGLISEQITASILAPYYPSSSEPSSASGTRSVRLDSPRQHEAAAPSSIFVEPSWDTKST